MSQLESKSETANQAAGLDLGADGLLKVMNQAKSYIPPKFLNK